MAVLTTSGKRLILVATSIATYREKYTIVDDSAGAGELLGPLATGTNVTLPNSGTYTSSELVVMYNGVVLTPVVDYNYVSSTQVSFNIILEGTRKFPSIVEFYKVS